MNVVNYIAIFESDEYFCQGSVQEEHEEEFFEPLPCISLFGNLYTEYATSFSVYFGSEKRPEMIGKGIFLEKFLQKISFFCKKLNKNQT